MIKISLSMQKKLDMTPIPKLTIPIGQFRSALKLGKSIRVLCPKNRDAENEFGDGMAGLRARDPSIAADLNRQIDKRNHDANRSDDLPEICEVIEIHGSQLQPAGRLRSIARTCADSVFDLVFVLRAIKVAFRFCNEAVIVDPPKFIAADSNVFFPFVS